MTEVVSKEEQIPAYLNEDCLQKALENACRTSSIAELKNVQWKLSNIVGGNYCSNIYRVKGSYKILPSEELQEFNFVIKDTDMEVAENGTNETITLNTVLPAMERILKSNKTKELPATSNKLGPSCFYNQSNEEHEFYILEDLNALGYKLGNRYEGLSVTQAKLVMEKIAKFHAASMVYAEQCPDIFAHFKPSQFFDYTPDPTGENLTKKYMDCALEILEVTDKEFISKMKGIRRRYLDKIRGILTLDQAAFIVLNHGDLWVSNILFKEQLETKSDAIFLDFQNSYWGSPIADLYGFLYTSLSLETLQTQRFELLHHYYKALKATLESLKYAKIPTWSDLLKEYKRGAILGYYVALCEFPFCVANDEAVKDFKVQEFLESSTKWKAIFKTSKVRQFIWHAVLHFQEIGLFDQ